LIVSEGIYPSAMGKGYLFSPGLHTPEQAAGWKRVTAAVHGEGGAIFGQIMHVGRLSDPLMLDGRQPIAPSAVQPDPTARHYTITCPRPKRPYPQPRAMTHAEVLAEIDGFRSCAVLAQQAGFDGVEIHAASGYLPMQFLSTNSNVRDDQWGGSVEKRAAFLLACVDAMTAATSPGFVAVKISPGWSFHNVFDDDPVATYSHVTRELSKRGIAYLQIGDYDVGWDVHGTLRPLFDGPVMAVAGFTLPTAAAAVSEGRADMVALGQAFISNPDLAERYRNGWMITRPDVSTYYTQGAEGYTDYPVHADSDPDLLQSLDTPPIPISPATTG
jgi:N-ethylmaleimide reductase